MLRHLAVSWLFAGFLVVVAVTTWRVLDARSPAPPTPTPTASPVAPAIVVRAVPAPTAEPAQPDSPNSSCGATSDPFDADRAAPAPSHAQLSKLQLGSQPFADTIIDGRRYGSTPFYGPRQLTLALGAHEVELHDKSNDRRYHYRLHIHAAAPANKVTVVLRDDVARAPHTTGAVTMTLLDMKEHQARQVFSDAVDALRDRRTARGCDLLERIIDRSPSSSRWAEKAAMLFSRRCD